MFNWIAQMQDMRWDKTPRGTSQEVQKMYFYGGNNLLAQTEKKKKKVLLQTKQKTP